jgi:hypothetical protein
MKTDELKEQEAELWAYLHGELPEEVTRRIEDALSRSDDPKALFPQMQQLDGLLAESYRQGERDQSLSAEIEAIYDRDTDGALEGPSRPGFGKRLLPFLIVAPQRWTLVAATAALVALSFGVYGPRPSVKWARPEVVPVTYRGGTLRSENASQQFQKTAASFAEQLETSTANELQKRKLHRRRHFTKATRFSLTIHEYPDGALLADIAGWSPDGRMIGEWSVRAHGMEALEGSIPKLTAEIADRIASFSEVAEP